MIQKAFLLFFLISSSSLFACQLQLNKAVYYQTKKSLEPQSFIEKTDCSSIIQKQAFDYLANSIGHVRVSSLNFIKGITKIIGNKIEIEILDELVAKRLQLKNNIKIENLNLVSNQEVISLNQKEQLKVHCDQCQTPGKKNISLKVYGRKHGQPVLWASANLLQRTEVLESVGNIPAFKKNLFSQFKKIYRYVERPEQYFVNKSQLSYYKANKFLPQGTLLRSQDISPLTLVRFGDQVRVRLIKNNLSLVSRAKSKRSGRYGDVIELSHLKTGNSFFGKIVGPNQVEVNL